jgi:hypothetical protein
MERIEDIWRYVALSQRILSHLRRKLQGMQIGKTSLPFTEWRTPVTSVGNVAIFQ